MNELINVYAKKKPEKVLANQPEATVAVLAAVTAALVPTEPAVVATDINPTLADFERALKDFRPLFSSFADGGSLIELDLIAPILSLES
jgi:hypothetical protein